MSLSTPNDIRLISELTKVRLELMMKVHDECMGKIVYFNRDGKCIKMLVSEIDISQNGDMLFYGKTRDKYNSWQQWISCILGTAVTKIIEGYEMITSEYEFGKLVAELALTGRIHGEDERKDFIKVGEHMKDLLISYWHNEDSELCFNDPLFEAIWKKVAAGDELEEDEIEWVCDGIETMMDDLVEGDSDDAFGPSGWKDHFGW